MASFEGGGRETESCLGRELGVDMGYRDRENICREGRKGDRAKVKERMVNL